MKDTTINLHFQSSSCVSIVYKVTLLQEDGDLEVHCDCPAGIHGTLCKHKLALFGNDPKLLLNHSEEGVLLDAHNIVRDTPLMAEYTFINEANEKINALKKELLSVKKRMSGFLCKGFSN